MRIDGGRPIQRRTVSWDPATGLLVVGGRRTTVRCAPGDNECVLRTYLGLVAAQRDVPVSRSIHLRHDDIAVLAELLDLDDADLEARLVRLLHLSERDAEELRHQFLRHKIAAATLGVGLLAAVPVGVAAAATTESAPPSSTTTTSSTTVAVDPPTTMTVVVTVPTTAPAPVAAPAPTRAAQAAAPEPASAPTPAAPTPAPAETDVGTSVRYERDPDYTPPDGVEIGDAMVIERDAPPPEG